MEKDKSKQVVVRFPPSPTGEIHIGNVRTLLFNYLFARQNNGKIVFRFEDTDAERSKREYEQPMLDALTSMGLSWDQEPVRQSDRIEIYNKYLHLLVEADLAYEDVENQNKTGKIIRLRNVEREIVWKDLVKGEIKINTHTFKERDEEGNFTGDNAADIIIARSITDPIYHFTVVVDDWLMGITHVIRGDDHITSTPRQIMILEALRDLQLTEEPKVEIPQYAHLPTIIGSDKKKLSKRNGNTSLQKYLDAGYLKEAIVNYLAFLGWNPGGEREFFTLSELVQEFSFPKCQKSPAQFDILKLDHINKHYLARISDDEFFARVFNLLPQQYQQMEEKDLVKFKKIVLKVYRDRVSRFPEVIDADANGENNMFFESEYEKDFETFDKQKFCFKNKDANGNSQTVKEVQANMKMVLEKIGNISTENWTADILKAEIWDWSATVGRGQILHPLRMVMSLRDKSPDPFTIMEIIGRTESLRRLGKIENL